MAKVLGGKHAVPLEDVVLAQAFQLDALMNVLERQGMLKKAEAPEEIKALQAKTPKATWSEEWRRYGWGRSIDRCPR